MKSKTPERRQIFKNETFQSTQLSEKSLSPKNKLVGCYKKLSKFIQETEEIKSKKKFEEKKRNRIKQALELHQQLNNELAEAAVFIQKHVRGYIARKYYKEMLIEKYEYENLLLNLDKEIGDY